MHVVAVGDDSSDAGTMSRVARVGACRPGRACARSARSASRAGAGTGARAACSAPSAAGSGVAGAEIGLVSVVVVPEHGDRVEECLASVRGQTHALLDVVVCPVGSAAAELPDDPRFRAIAPAATAYAAVNAGIAAATGPLRRPGARL